ncbi:MAG: TolC family protein [Deltaproteobacteria bacterium]|nr:TolC family protein [Deltaproteobacteria bacterium]
MKNYNIMRLKLGAEALKENIEISKSLPDPRIAFGYNDSDGFNNFAVGNNEYPGSKFRYTFTQYIPFPTKLFLKSKIAKYSFNYADETTKSAVYSTAANVKNYYYRLALFERDITIIKSDYSLLKLLEKNTTERYTFGKAKETDVIRIDLRMVALKNKLIRLKKDRLKTLYKLSRITQIKLTGLKGSALFPKKVKLDIKNFKKTIAEVYKDNPAIKAVNFLYDKSKFQKKLADQSLYPDIIFHVKYGYRYGIQPALGGSIGFVVPLYFNSRQIPEMKKAKKNMISSLFGRVWAYDGADKIVRTLLLNIKKYYKLYMVEKKVYIPESSLLFKLYVNRYIFGKVSAFELLNAFKKKVKAELLSYDYEFNLLKNEDDLSLVLGKIHNI